MTITQTIQFIIATLEVFIPLFIGLFILIIGKNIYKKILLLFTFLILFGFTSISDIISITKYQDIAQNIDHISTLLMFLTPLILYHFINQFLIHKKRLQTRIISTIGLFCFSIGSIIYTLSYPISYLKSSYFEIIEILCFFYFMAICIMVIYNIINHNKTIHNQYSKTENRNLNWALYATLYYFLFLFAQLFMYIINIVPDIFLDIIGFLTSFLWISSLAYFTLYYEQSKDLFILPIEQSKPEKTTTKNIQLKNEDLLSIENLIITEKLFLNEDLTVAHIAHRIDKHPKTISQIINKYALCNFNSYINQIRVQYATTLIRDASTKSISLEGIGQISGFKTNSTFYKAFKKEMHQTPKQYADAQKRQHTAE